jgi:hypothetical protein
MQRVRADYLEMPRLRLSAAQVGRLCNVEPTICLLLLDALVTERFLCLKPDERYGRAIKARVPGRQPANANITTHARSTIAS